MDQLTTTVRNQSWLQMIKDQKSSGLSIKQWCIENHISENCFFYRQKKLRESAGNALQMFIEVPKPDDRPHLENSYNNSAAQIVSGNVVIEINNNASEELIDRIVRVLDAK